MHKMSKYAVHNYPAWLSSWKAITLIGISILVLVLAIVWPNTDCYQLGVCHSKSLPSVSHFVGREEDIHNITGYLDFSTSDVQVVHIVGPPGFGKSTLAMKIGEIFVKKWVRVHYADVKMVRDIDILSENIVSSMVHEPRKRKVTFNDLEIKIQKQYSNTLIIVDNCDELFEHSKHEFLEALESLISSPLKNVKYLLTSQKWVADIGNFQLHAIYNLSSEAAIQLLNEVGPRLTDDQKKQIADLTGNVPLALKVIGAIFKFPDAPSAEMVIKGLKEHPLHTLSPTELHHTVDVSIGLAYSYLTPELKRLCVNLSHFPGSFDNSSAYFLFEFDTDIRTNLTHLVQRSLLQSSHGRQRYHFHQLIKTFFLGQETRTTFQLYFDTQFQSYFTGVLQSIISDYSNGLKLTRFDEEKQNIRHMLGLFERSRNLTVTFNGIKTIMQAIESNILQLRFLPVEIRNISQDMLTVLDSYMANEQAKVNLFLYTYTKLVKLVARQQWSTCKAEAIKTLNLRKERVNEGHRLRRMEASTFTEFYSLLIQYHEENGDTREAARYHTHVLKTIHGQLKHCYPHCDYYDISVAYKIIGNREKAFHFRELAYQHQLRALPSMTKAILLVELHNDYSKNNDSVKKKHLSAMIIKEVYPYLITVDKSEYLKELYYTVVDFFRAQNLENQVVPLQNKMISCSVPCSENNCDKSQREGEYFEHFKSLTEELAEDSATLRDRCEFKCAVHYADMAQEAYDRKCYHLAIWAGEQSCAFIDKLGDPYTILRYGPQFLIARSQYEIGKNNSATQILLKQALQHINDAIRLNYFSMELRKIRTELCGDIILLDWPSNPLFYIYALKDFTSLIVISIPFVIAILPFPFWAMWFKQEEIILSTDTGVAEQKYSLSWSLIYPIYSPDMIEWWIGKIQHLALLAVLVIGTTIYYLMLYMGCRHYIIPCIFRRRVLYTILFIALIILATDWL